MNCLEFHELDLGAYFTSFLRVVLFLKNTSSVLFRAMAYSNVHSEVFTKYLEFPQHKQKKKIAATYAFI